MSRSIGFVEVRGMTSLNLTGIYLQLGNAAAAAEAAEQGVRDLAGTPNVGFRAQLLGQLGNARGWTGKFEEALSFLRESIWEADATGDVATLAIALDYAGNHCLRRGDLAGAEAAYLKAYLTRKLRKPDELHYSHANLGRLRLAQGDLAAADNLFSLALEQATRAPSLVQVWSLYHGRGRVRRAQGRQEEALADFRMAVDLARRWRIGAVASDALRIRTDAGLHEVYGAYIQTGNRVALAGGTPELARVTFSVAEEHRAAGLRERWNESGPRNSRLPEEYWAVLADLQTAEIAALRNPEPAVAGRRAGLRLRLIEMEAQAGMPQPAEGPAAGGDLSRSIQRGLGVSDALLSFDFEGDESYLWAVTRESFALHALSRKGELGALVVRFRDAVRQDAPEAAAAGRELYASLFGRLPAVVRRKARWILVLDDVLFEAPLAALVTGERGGRPAYLIEEHSLLTVPSGASVLEAGEEKRISAAGLFVGVGDPIYNRADPRRLKEDRIGWPRSSPSPAGLLELPRLAASGLEIRKCSRRWNGAERVLLEGAAASRRGLATALGRRPSVLHLAAHVMAAPDRMDSAVIALSLLPADKSEILTSAEIAVLGAARLVVLSGCSSGSGAALPGAGLIGLTRAWLAGGAERVVASLWPTPDDVSELFLAFYSHLGSDPRGAAE
ncbi:MAG: CHAT domain-containing protein, partial [Acidobacteria bacterium]|nr:CHAT domain-containing protein [Acidobacteriota bacterium]